MGKKLSDQGLSFLIEQETGRPSGAPSLRPFSDGGAGGWSIGYGHFLGHFPTQPNITITAEQAKRYLIDDVAAAEKVINTLILTNLTQNQFDALVSLLYNVGTHIFDANNPKSAFTLLKYLNTRNWAALPQYFETHFIRDEAGNPVLISRRRAEMRLFFRGLV